MTTTQLAPAAAVAQDFLRGVVARDLPALERLLDPQVWFRMLLPRSIVEAHDVPSVLRAFHEWFVTPHEIEPLGAAHDTIEGREHVTWRFRLRPQWAPDTWHVIEQTGYVRVADGRVRRLDLVCTGFHPVT